MRLTDAIPGLNLLCVKELGKNINLSGPEARRLQTCCRELRLTYEYLVESIAYYSSAVFFRVRTVFLRVESLFEGVDCCFNKMYGLNFKERHRYIFKGVL